MMASYKWNESESSAVENSISNSSHAPASATQSDRFRIRVCLRRVYGDSDPRARCYVSVAPSHRVRWLEKRLCTLLGLNNSFVLRSRGYLLPRAERLTILQPDDPVEVFPITLNGKENGKVVENSSVSFGAQAEPSLDVTDGEKELLASLYHTMVLPVKENKLIQDNETETDLIACKDKALALLDMKYSQNQNEKDDSLWIMEDYSGDHQCKRRKRVRRRKHKNFSHECTDSFQEETSSQTNTSVPITLVETRAPRLVPALP